MPKSKIADDIKKVAPDYDYSQLESMDDLLDSGDHEVNVFRRGEVIDGVVVRVQVEEIMLDVGLKAEGVVVGRELFDPHLMDSRPELEIGESIPVYVVQPEGEGAAMLSIRRALQEKLWRETETLYNEGKIIESRVTEFNKGGVLVDVGPRGFVPMSQLVSLAPAAPDETREDVAARLSELVNKTLKLKIIEMDRRRNRPHTLRASGRKGIALRAPRAAPRRVAGRPDAQGTRQQPGQLRRVHRPGRRRRPRPHLRAFLEPGLEPR